MNANLRKLLVDILMPHKMFLVFTSSMKLNDDTVIITGHVNRDITLLVHGVRMSAMLKTP